MPETRLDPAPSRLPEGFRAVAIHPVAQAPIRLCVLARNTPDPVTGHFVILRDHADARVYLGCLADAGSRPLHWVELWVQNVDGLEGRLPALREAFANPTLDRRWQELSEALAGVSPGAALLTGWEAIHPAPCFLDLNTAAPVVADGIAWQLCRDDAALAAAGLPGFATSLHRYLHQPGTPSTEARFLPVSVHAPVTAATRPLGEALGAAAGHFAFNPQGGLLRAVVFAPLGLEEFLDLLGGRPWKGLECGRKTIPFDGPYARLANWEQMAQQDGFLFLGGQGAAARTAETLHLKLRALYEAFALVRGVVAHTQLPFLNLAADSFRVRLSDLGPRLPFLWSARLQLARPGDAFALPLPSTATRHFVRAGITTPSIYRPDAQSRAAQASATFRLRKVTRAEGGTVLEGTLVLEERQTFSPHDLVWLRVVLGSTRHDLYGHLYGAEGLAAGELRFRSLPLQIAETQTRVFIEAEGAAFPRTALEILPHQSTPCDLHSLGVLSARALLVNDENTLAVAVDEVLSLARRLGTEGKAEEPLHLRVGRLLDGDPRLGQALGPQRLWRTATPPEGATASIPPALWNRVLAFLVRLFPGAGPASICADYGDAREFVLESVFDPALEDLDRLVVLSRSLIVTDAGANREMLEVIQAARSALAGVG